MPTVAQFHICQSLPLVHGDNPSFALPSTTEINNKLGLVSTEATQHRFQSIQGEFTRWKKERSHYNLIRSVIQ